MFRSVYSSSGSMPTTHCSGQMMDSPYSILEERKINPVFWLIVDGRLNGSKSWRGLAYAAAIERGHMGFAFSVIAAFRGIVERVGVVVSLFGHIQLVPRLGRSLRTLGMSHIDIDTG